MKGQFAILLGIVCMGFVLSFVGSHCQNKRFALVAFKSVIGVEKNGSHMRGTQVIAFMVTQSVSIEQMQFLHFFSTKFLLGTCTKVVQCKILLTTS